MTPLCFVRRHCIFSLGEGGGEEKKKERSASRSRRCARPKRFAALKGGGAQEQMQKRRAKAGVAAKRSRHTACRGKRKILADWTRCLLLRSTHGRYTRAGGPAHGALSIWRKVEQSLGSINPHHFQKKRPRSLPACPACTPLSPPALPSRDQQVRQTCFIRRAGRLAGATLCLICLFRGCVSYASRLIRFRSVAVQCLLMARG